MAQNGHAFVTDGGHWLLDAQLQRIADPQALADRLSAIPGVMEHGLFIGLAGLLFSPVRTGFALSNGLDLKHEGSAPMIARLSTRRADHQARCESRRDVRWPR